MGPHPRLLLPALLLTACATAATPGPSVRPRSEVDLRERTIEYEVRGATSEALGAALDAAAPRVEGRRFRGVTRWNARWRFRTTPSGFSCEITDVEVRLTVTTTVPRWDPPAGAEPGLAGRWADYRKALDRHEAGHRDLAVRAANDVARTLGGVRTGCAVAAEEANARADWIVERYRDLNRRYDVETGHGRTQGASWPGPEVGSGGAVHAGSPER